MSKQILTINPEIHIGTGDVELYLEVSIEGKAIISKKADSLVANFLRLIYSFMASEVIPDGLLFHESNGDIHLEEPDQWGGITGVTPGATTVITHATNRPTTGTTTDDYINLYGIAGITPDINGLHQVIATTSTTKTIAVSTTGSFVDEGARVRRWQRIEDRPERASEDTFNSFMIRVGRSSVDNIVDQQTLINDWDPSEGPGEPFELDYGVTTVSTPAINYTTKTGELTFSCQVTNNSGATIEIGEIGLFAEIHDDPFDDRYSLIARDTVTPFSLGTGISTNISYTIKTTQLPSGGGFTDAFIKALAVQFEQSASQTFTDILGSTTAVDEGNGILMAVGPSGLGKVNTILNGVAGYLVGLQLGTGNTAPTFADTDLDARIEHGEGAGQLIHYGTIVDNFRFVGSTVRFDLTKIFENRSGGTIGINEVGLVTAMRTVSGALFTPTLIARYVLPIQTDVENFEIVKFVMGFTLTVAT